MVLQYIKNVLFYLVIILWSMIIGNIFFNFFNIDQFDSIYTFATLVGIVWMVLNGQLINSKILNLFLIPAVTLFVGQLFKIGHWPGGNEISLIAQLMLWVLYLYFFIKIKPTHNYFDWLKIIWFTIFILNNILIGLKYTNQFPSIVVIGLTELNNILFIGLLFIEVRKKLQAE